MNKSAILFLLLASPALFAAPIDDFLGEVSSTFLGSGAESAIKLIDGKIAGGLSGDDAGRCLTLKAQYLIELKQLDDGAKILVDQVLPAKDVTAKTKLNACMLMLDKIPIGYASGNNLIYLRKACEIARELPEFAKPGPDRGNMLYFVAKVNAKRNFCDIAYALCREAAENFGNMTEEKAQALFAAAENAVRYRNTEDAMDALKAIEKIPDIPLATAKKAKLRQGMALITPDQYDWQPKRERVENARKLIEDALALHGHQQFISAEDIFTARSLLVTAEYKSGNPKGAADLGVQILAGPEAKKADGRARGNLAILVADIMAETGDWRNAIKYYDQGKVNCDPGPKTINKRIAGVARQHKDYQRAMQAYADAADLCDREEGKDEWNLMKRLAGIMSNAIRNKTSLSDSEDVFGNADDNINGLQLDDF